MLTDIVLDAMGSDKGPDPEIRGAIAACRQFPVRVHLVGPENMIRPLLEEHLRGERLPIHVVHASEWISMDDKAAASVRSKKDSSMRVGLKLVREGKARGFVTAGNTGAAMATAKMVLGTLDGVDRPALATILPTQTGSPCVMLDVGANVDSDPQNLVQFALMGQIYAQNVLGIPKPRVGLLSIGEEDSKGNALTRETLPLLRALEGEQIYHFIGNVEGRDLFNGRCDVVVCDGFVGNVAIKTTEGVAKLVSEILKQTLKATITSQVGALLSRKAFKNFKRRLDYSEYGGAPLLGVRGACIIGHGSSNEIAILNAIRVASQFAQADVARHIEASLSRIK
ncbi:phosphate:acyl-(acyl carrier protein) acyltransferase [Terriglobus roseus DSM 18391]|uniref:Phosphate acyltransferase n=1 Tax=Terriglobus roseus (strain DSM 18391 / NRRL B-41598 / KBS 63) TaxID=926566 RepID=I3ZM13_TERRK|nr:phosphate acyltransferase PlsX [Terriglobus roseus]AFL90281.1 phosphate:acyl-(acyl carrier protein) acyltransferase [Terriglobus roseus DSM 18391]